MVLALGILISGRGSNMQALIEACALDSFPARVAVVISDKPDAAGLEIARANGIEAVAIDRKLYAAKNAFEQVVDRALRDHEIDIVCLAGFMRILSANFIAGWEGRIINIHPSLLPAYKGLDTHARVLAAGEAESGCTVHYVTPEMDAGPVILQRRVTVRSDDTSESLGARILTEEHIAYPEAVRRIAAQMIVP